MWTQMLHFETIYSSAASLALSNSVPMNSNLSAQVSPPSMPFLGLMHSGELTLLQIKPAKSNSSPLLPVAHMCLLFSQIALHLGHSSRLMTKSEVFS